MSREQEFRTGVKKLFHIFMALFSLLGIVVLLGIFWIMDPHIFSSNKSKAYSEIEIIDDDRIENGIHLRTGLVDGDGLMTVVNNCTNCHSAKLVTQNRMSAERWNATIRWMQETQNLWDLGPNQDIIVNYLVTNYPVQDVGRRAVLSNIEWYELDQ